MSAISIENFESKKRINSPRSLEACCKLGLQPEDLIKIKKEDYIKMFPECKNLEDNLIQQRYDHYEQNRNENIKKVNI